MCIVKMVIGLTPYGVMALIANVMATSDFAAIVDLGKFIIFSYVAIIAMFIVHLIILAANRVNPRHVLEEGVPCAVLRVRVAHERGCFAYEHRDAVEGARR